MDWEGNTGKGDQKNVRKMEWVPDHRTGNTYVDLLEHGQLPVEPACGDCLLCSASLSAHAG